MALVKRILITGGSGLIGQALTPLLIDRGHEVVHLSRSEKANGVPSFVWDANKGFVDERALGGVDTIVHLAGAGIADKRWTAKRKAELIFSRTASAQLLFRALQNKKHIVRTFISASGIGYYGQGEQTFTENDGPGKDFLAGVCSRWEEAADRFGSLGLRVVKIRTGVVLSARGGALPKLSQPVKLFVGAPLGAGKQILPWIHMDDLCAIYLKAVEEETISGSYNAVAPHPTTNAEMTSAIAEVLKKPLILPPIPAFVLKALLGELADTVLYGSAVSPGKILRAGFKFKFDRLKDALQDIYQ